MRAALKAAALFNAVQILTAVAFLAVPVLAPAIARDLGVSTTLVGTYSALLWIGGMTTSTLAGRLIARFGAVRMTQMSLVLCAFGLLVAGSGWTHALVIVPLAIGFGCGVETPSSSAVLAHVTPPAHRPLVFSLKQTGVQIGGMMTGLLLPALLPLLGWRGSFLATGAVIAVCAAAMEPARRDYDARLPRERRAARGIGAAVREVLANPTLRSLALVSFVFHCVQVCLNTFLVSYLVTELAFSLAAAGALLSVAQFGGFTGRIGTGLAASRHLPVLKLLIAIGFAMAIVSAALGFAGESVPHAALALIAFLFGLTASGWNGIFLAEIAREVPAEDVGRVTGGILITGYLGLILAPLAFGAIAAGADYSTAFILLGAWAAAGTVVLMRASRAAHRPPI